MCLPLPLSSDPVSMAALVQGFSSIVKAVPLQARSGPEGSRKLRFPDFVTVAQDGGRLSALRTGRFLPPGNSPGTHFCQRLSLTQGPSAIGRILCQ